MRSATRVVTVFALCACSFGVHSKSDENLDKGLPLPEVHTLNLPSAPISIQVVEAPEKASEESSRQRQSATREANDLVAQLRAAKAAEDSAGVNRALLKLGWIQVGISIAGALIAVAGTWLLLSTLKLNRAATSAAVRAADYALADQRPWVKIDEVAGAKMTIGETSIGIPVLLQNVGRSPAVDISIRAELRVLSGERHVDADWAEVMKSSQHGVLDGVVKGGRFVLFPGESASVVVTVNVPKELRMLDNSRKHSAVLSLSVAYRNQDIHATVSAFGVWWERFRVSPAVISVSMGDGKVEDRYGFRQIPDFDEVT